MCKGIFTERINDVEISYELLNGNIVGIVAAGIKFNNLNLNVNEFTKDKLIELLGF
ncbi:MAG: hypothetical protein ACRCTZ_04355 [Sarcina sp.]